MDMIKLEHLFHLSNYGKYHFWMLIKERMANVCIIGLL